MKSKTFQAQHEKLRKDLIEEILYFSKHAGTFIVGAKFEMLPKRYRYCRYNSVKLSKGLVSEGSMRGIRVISESFSVKNPYSEVLIEYERLTTEDLILLLEFIEKFWKELGIDLYDRRYPIKFDNQYTMHNFREDIHGAWIDDVQYSYNELHETYYRKDMHYAK